MLAHEVSVAQRAPRQGRLGFFVLCEEKHHLFAHGTPMYLKPIRLNSRSAESPALSTVSGIQ